MSKVKVLHCCPPLQVGLRQVASQGHVTTPGRSQTGPAQSHPCDRSKTKQAFGCRGPEESGSNAPTGISKTASGDPRTRRPSFVQCRRQEVGCWGPRRTTAPARAAHSPVWTHRSSSREGDDRTCKRSWGRVGRRDWPDWCGDLDVDKRGQSQHFRPRDGHAKWHKWSNPRPRGVKMPGFLFQTCQIRSDPQVARRKPMGHDTPGCHNR